VSGPLRRLSFALAIAALLLPATAEASFTQEPGSPYDVGAEPYGVVAGDFTGDGRPDVASINGTSSNVSLLRRQPTGGFAEDPAPRSVAGGPNFAASAEFNNDGLRDLAVANFTSTSVSILKGQAGGGFAADAPVSVGFQQTGIATADFDSDGDFDLAVLDWFGNKVHILKNQAGVFTLEPGPATTGAQPRNVAVADFNGDARPDLAVSSVGGPGNQVTILLRQPQPTGGFTADIGSPITVGNTPVGITADDLNGDGRPDVAVANYADDTVTLLLRQAVGFETRPPISVGDSPTGIATGDFNSDGLRDLVTANASSSVNVMLGVGGGSFAPDPSSPVATDTGAYNVAVADFDGDTRQDLAITNTGDDTVTVLLNTTPFPAPPPPPPPLNLDADGDGVQRPLDCDDNNAAIKPGAVDVPGDGVDQDCSGADSPYPALDRDVSYAFAIYAGGYTKLTKLAVKPMRASDRVVLTCAGRGCQTRRKAIAVAKDGRKLSLLRYVRRAKFRRGAVLKVRVTRPATVGVFFSLRFRGTKAPLKRDACLLPGTQQPSRCPG
jgi:hypothetical protein